jgi:flagellar motor protein MotB
VEPNTSIEGRARNRRVTVLIEPDDKAPTTVLQ